LWLQPGGHIDPGEAPWQAAIREAQEETGLPVEPLAGLRLPALVHVDVHPGPRGHTHLDLRYLLVADDVEPNPGARESPDVRWFPWADAIAQSDAGLAGILRALAPADVGTLVVRRAAAADAAAVAALYLRSRRHAMPTIVSPHTDDVRDWVAAHLVAEQETWVAEVAGVVVGVLALSATAPHRSGLAVDQLYVDQLYLDPPWIGRGLGAILVDHAKQRSPGGLELWTFQVNAAARRFYARQGFVEVDWTDGAGNEEHEPDVRCRWG
jgi:ADP-ribose pyrophosphatase YjhB (NUDIX family)/GNAT superfamily N-acetyltransferase